MSTLADAVGPRPPKMTVTNIVTGDVLEAQYNPTELEEKVGANWARLAALGNSHETLQFTNGKNDLFNFTLFWSSANGGPAQQTVIERARRFLKSVVKPRSVIGGGLIKSAGAPRVLFVWPNLLSVECIVTDVTLKHTRFNLLGQTVFYSAVCALEVIRDDFISSDDVLNGKD